MHRAQLKNLHNVAVGAYGKSSFAGLKEPGFDFVTVVGEGRTRERARFIEAAKGMCHDCIVLRLLITLEVTIEGPEWEYETELGAVDEAMEMMIEVFRGEETKKMINAIDVGLSCGP